MHATFSTKHSSVFTRFITFVTVLVLVALPVSVAFAFDTGFSSPASASAPGKSWTNVAYSLASDNLYATSKRVNKQLRLSNFTIPGIAGGSVVTGIEVTVEGFTGGLQANVALSHNGGSSYTDPYITAFTGTESTITLGGPTNTWGRTWSASEFTNTNFVVKLTTTGTGAPINVDQVQVKVHFTAPLTTLTLAPVSGPYGGTASMTATLTLTADGTPVPGKTIDFYIGGNGIDSGGNCSGTFAGIAVTDDSGVAILASAGLAGIRASSYPYGACARFGGDGSYQATSITSTLTVVGNSTELTVLPATGTYGEAVALTATLTSGGVPVFGEWVTFNLFGNGIASSKTNSSGIASLSNVSLVGYNAGASNDIGASFDGSNDLGPASALALITINQRPITVTAVKDTKLYDGATNSTVTPKITGFLVTGDVAGFTQTFDTKHVGTNKTLAPAGVVEDDNSGQNYNVTFEAITTGVINKAGLTVTAANKTKKVGQADPVFTFNYTGLVSSDTSADINTAPTCTVSVAHNVAGTYPITCSGGVDNNYSFSYVNGTLTVSAVTATFVDVPTNYWAWSFIESLYSAGVTSGCSTSPLLYCPTTTVTRDQMAVFLLRAKHGSSYTPPAATGVFQDVPTNYWAARWIEQLAAEGITGGCSVTPKLYCPTTPVTRDQMAVFLLKAKHGASYTPPAPTGVFQDVPTNHWAARWIERLAAEGITGGCSTSPMRYCPATPVTRDQMAVFLVRTFNLP